MNYSLLFILFIGSSISLSSQQSRHTIKKDENIMSPEAKIGQVAWIAGHWKGEAFGGITEEVWTAPSAGAMMGSFKLSQGNEVKFYEICVIRELDNTILLQLKHFNNDLKGWEEKDETVDFPLVKIENDKVFFDQFTFEKIGKNEMHLYVVIHQEGQEEQEVQFIYHRAKA